MRKSFLFAIAMLLVASVGYAQRVELTPSIGYRWGGTIEYDETELFSTDVQIGDSASYGLTLGLPVGRSLLVEVSANRQASEFQSDSGLFDDEFTLADVDVTYYQLGLTWQLDQRYYRPYFGVSLGGATIDPDIEGASSENRFAGTLGGGVKFELADHLDFKLDARGYWIALDSGDGNDCDYRCYDYDEGDVLTQGEVSAGLVFSF